ncbi:hypothetical protein CRI94_11155 [Longibacter salinarum]|uniref:Protein argonaute n=2 Tax=Longibacter salinarum TaxID=1850348 RepID=A0A2A8CWX1_9BACT|nr:hypothetical protein CRI94_11155 [Longibacter salinarum]
MAFKNRSSSNARQGLVLNALEISFNNRTVTIPQADYSKERWDSCLEDFPDVWFYRLNDHLYAITSGSSSLGLPDYFDDAEISLRSHSPVFAQIAAESIHRYFSERTPGARRNAYDGSWEVPMSKQKALSVGLLKVTPMLKYTPRPLYSTSGSEPVLVLVVQTYLRHEFLDSEDANNAAPLSEFDISWQKQDDSDEVYASKRNVLAYLAHLGKIDQYNKYDDKFYAQGARFRNFRIHTHRLNNIRSLLDLPGSLCVDTFTPFLLPSKLFDVRSIRRPVNLFYNDRKPKSREYLNDAVKRLRPYSYDKFQGKVIQIALLAAESREQEAVQYSRTLKDKLQSLFHLSQVEVSIHTFEPSTAGIAKFLRDFDASSFDLAVPIMAESLKNFPVRRSPYHTIKARLLNQATPSQDITIESVHEDRRMINANVALNIYAKLGGTAWAVRRSAERSKQFVVGVGATTDEDGDYIIGFANVFTHDGRYLLGECHQLSSMDEYADDLQDYLSQTLLNALQSEGIAEGETIELVLHLFKEASRKREIKAIEKAIHSDSLSPFNIKYVIIHISENHPYRLFEDGRVDSFNQSFEIRISTRQSLLQMGGGKERPFLLRLDRRGDYEEFNFDDLTRQIVEFSNLSHLSFIPPSTPVTVSYPKKMARVASDLRKVPNWDPAMMNRLSGIPWFI